MLRTCLLLALAASPALACEKIERVTEFLGWTADGVQFAWKVTETEVCNGCRAPEGDEHVFVGSMNSPGKEFLTRWVHPGYAPPELPGLTEWNAWKKAHPLVLDKKAQAKAPSAIEVKALSKPLVARGNEFCATKETALELALLSHGRSTSEWRGGAGSCGCVRAWVAPGGGAAAFLTGPAKSVCDDCHGTKCCAAPEAITVRGN